MKRIDEYQIEEDDGSIWHIKEKGRRVWWEDRKDIGTLTVSFDRKKRYNLWTDYPDKFTEEEKNIFDSEEKYWANFFKGKSRP